MGNSLVICLFTILFIGCQKDRNRNPTTFGCDMQQVYADNSKKVTITNGVWGTISLMEGDYMPSVPYTPCIIHQCPVSRTVKIYQYTTINNTIPTNPFGPFFDSLNTQLATQVNTDKYGFFQAEIQAGEYSMFVVENGKLYANKKDSIGGLNPFSLSTGTINVNLALNYVTH